jgi:hypothetical protein
VSTPTASAVLAGPPKMLSAFALFMCAV